MGAPLTRVVGVDLGTRGLRGVAVTHEGAVVASASVDLVDGAADPHVWLAALETVLDRLTRAAGPIGAIACAGTSGTVIPTDARGVPVGAAILYDDLRAATEAEACAAALGVPMNASFGLPKMLWLARHQPAPRCLHAADVLHAWLLGALPATDFTSALKSGFPPGGSDWPDALPVPRQCLPRVVAPGDRLGNLRADLAARWDLREPVAIVAGATDANAAFYASGAHRVGDWNSALGSTLAVRGLSPAPVVDHQARFYNHRHPDGGWLVAGASHAGAAGLSDGILSSELPRALRYPLPGRGERLPFASADATAFQVGEDDDARTAGVYGLALIERWIYELAASLGAPPVDVVHATGGSARDELWLRVRANMLQRPVRRACHPDSAFGAAILAAACVFAESVGDAAARMVAADLAVDPDPTVAGWAEEALGRLQGAARERGYYRIIPMTGR